MTTFVRPFFFSHLLKSTVFDRFFFFFYNVFKFLKLFTSHIFLDNNKMYPHQLGSCSGRSGRGSFCWKTFVKLVGQKLANVSLDQPYPLLIFWIHPYLIKICMMVCGTATITYTVLIFLNIPKIKAGLHFFYCKIIKIHLTRKNVFLVSLFLFGFWETNQIAHGT